MRSHDLSAGARARHLGVAAILGTSLLSSSPLFGKPAARPLGDSRFIASVPAPGYPGDLGYPEGIAFRGNMVYVGTSATFGTSGAPPSKIFAFDARTGAQRGTYEMQGQDTSQEHGLSGMAFDGNGRLYVLDTQRGVVRLSIGGNGQIVEEVYAAIPDLAPCSAAAPGAPCSPTTFDRPPLPNDIAFDDAGNAYVTDSFQATIYRVPPGGGAAEIWFQDPRLDDAFGPNGIRLTPDRQHVYLAQTTTGVDFATTGYIYTLPLVDSPQAGDLATVHQYDFEGPDGFTVGVSGDLYVVLALSNQISVLGPDGVELGRYAGPAFRADGTAVPWDAPASVAIDPASRSLLVTNHALFSGAADHFGVFDVYVDDRENELAKPLLP